MSQPPLKYAALLLTAIALAGCCTHNKCAPSATWQTCPPARQSTTPGPDGRVLTVLFSGFEIHGTNSSAPALHAETQLVLSPIDEATKDVRLDLRGFAYLSRGAQAQCRVEWNGQVVHLSQVPCEEVFGVTNQNWSCYAYVPRKDIRPCANQLRLHFPLTVGADPAYDFIGLDSVDINWQTNRLPAQP